MRAFTPVLGTLVYAFSGLLAVYLLAKYAVLGTLIGGYARYKALIGERFFAAEVRWKTLSTLLVLPISFSDWARQRMGGRAALA